MTPALGFSVVAIIAAVFAFRRADSANKRAAALESDIADIFAAMPTEQVETLKRVRAARAGGPGEE